MPLDPTTVQDRIDEAIRALFDVAPLLDQAVGRLDEGHNAFEAAGCVDADFAECERLVEAAHAFVLGLVSEISKAHTAN